MKDNKQTPYISNSFDEIYKKYYLKLLRFSKEYVLLEADAENIVQDVFLYCWENREKLDTIQNKNAFLFRLVKNKCIDFLRQKIRVEEKSKDLYQIQLKEYNLRLQSIEQFDDSIFSEEELEQIIYNAIEKLPEKCREIFILNKLDGLSYEEIAEKMKLSSHTVRNQIAIAMKKIKTDLKDYVPLLLFLIF